MDILPNEIDRYEREAVANTDSLDRQRIAQLCCLVRKLRHELVDPSYLYAGGRIHRQALICREGQIDRLQYEVADLKRKVDELSKQLNPVGEAPQE